MSLYAKIGTSIDEIYIFAGVREERKGNKRGKERGRAALKRVLAASLGLCSDQLSLNSLSPPSTLQDSTSMQ